ncbi:hypothetical protein OG894_24425 [Streptomyces sp. NBC_01724]|uniref:hypothetical protein n=1 Tax=Streptomyces sp. NBC_01724 TaxID=2975922 RepID=UPI002E31DC64|nr:hypothetical protein [Streptomyces sp. NBC_01724]
MTTSAASARLVATLTAPLDRDRDAAYPPSVLRWPDRRLLIQRGDFEAVAVDLDDPSAAQTRFPAPWPRRFGTFTVAPGGDLAVFAGVHSVRAVDPAGAVRWEVRHGCWEGGCRILHESFDEYADSRSHLYADSGSAVFSADGSLVWAHVRGPVATAGPDPEALDEWLVIDAADGRVLGRADAQTVAAGSEHVPHPDPAQMGLSVGEGQDGAPLLWGRWDGTELSVEHFGEEERILTSVSPTGEHFLTVAHDLDSLALHRVSDGAVVAEIEAADAVPRHPDADPDDFDADDVMWDYECGFVDKETAISSTDQDEEYGPVRHWLLDATGMRPAGQVTYPFPVSGTPTALGDGTWYTVSGSGDAVHLWALDS